MHLYISSNNINIELSDITLVGGWLPSISGRKLDQDRGVEDCQLEPAIWFKIMVIDFLTIDCTAKVRIVTLHSDEMLLLTLII